MYSFSSGHNFSTEIHPYTLSVCILLQTNSSDSNLVKIVLIFIHSLVVVRNHAMLGRCKTESAHHEFEIVHIDLCL